MYQWQLVNLEPKEVIAMIGEPFDLSVDDLKNRLTTLFKGFSIKTEVVQKSEENKK